MIIFQPELISNISSIKWIVTNFHTLLTSLAALATCLAAFFAYRSINQMGKINKAQEQNQIRRATIEFVSDSDSGIPILSRKANFALIEFKPFLEWTIDDVENNLLKNYEDKEKIKFAGILLKQLKTRVPLNYCKNQNNYNAIVFEFNKILVFKPYELGKEPHTSISKLFNKVEDISNAIEYGVFDVYIVDKMYGGLISNSYLDHCDWLTWVKRKLGFRFFDQSDKLLDHIIINDEKIYNLNSKSFIYYLFRRLDVRFFFLALYKCIKNIQNRDYVDYSTLFRHLKYYKLDKKVNDIILLTQSDDIKFKEISLIKTTLPKKNIIKLFVDAVSSSRGVWPVGIVNPKEIDSIDDISLKNRVKDWIEITPNFWDYVILAERDRLRGPYPKIIGSVAITDSPKLIKHYDRWAGEIINAIKSHSIIEQKDERKYLLDSGIPLSDSLSVNSTPVIDFSKMAMIKGLYVHSNVRNRDNHPPVGRILLRKAISYIRNDLNKIPFLTVIADEAFTEKAIKLYIAEGGHFLGSVHDGLRKDQHLMHVFIF